MLDVDVFVPRKRQLKNVPAIVLPAPANQILNRFRFKRKAGIAPVGI